MLRCFKTLPVAYFISRYNTIKTRKWQIFTPHGAESRTDFDETEQV